MTKSHLKAHCIGPKSSTHIPDNQRTDPHQIQKVFIRIGGWKSNESPTNKGESNPANSSEPSNLLQESEPSSSRDYTLSRVLQHSQFLDDIDALLDLGYEKKLQVKPSYSEVKPLARFLSEGREEQACIIALEEKAGGLNISMSPPQ